MTLRGCYSRLPQRQSYMGGRVHERKGKDVLIFYLQSTLPQTQALGPLTPPTCKEGYSGIRLEYGALHLRCRSRG